LETALATLVTTLFTLVIESGFSKTSEINRNDLLVYKEEKINKQVPLVLTYHPSLEKIAGIVRHHWKKKPQQKPIYFLIYQLLW
jgi:hypothetical protein